MSKDNAAIEAAKKRLLELLDSQESVDDVGHFYKHPNEELYILEVFVPDSLALTLLERLDPLLDDIADNNAFTIGVLPLPPRSFAGK